MLNLPLYFLETGGTPAAPRMTPTHPVSVLGGSGQGAGRQLRGSVTAAASLQHTECLCLHLFDGVSPVVCESAVCFRKLSLIKDS